MALIRIPRGWPSTFSEIDSEDKFTAVEALKDDFFFELATVLNETGEPVYEILFVEKSKPNSGTGHLSLIL